LSVLFSIVLGLAITQVLNGVRGLVQYRAQVRHYWLCEGWAVLLLVMCVQSWWTMFGLREHTDWTFGQYAIVLLQLVLTYLLSGIVLPDIAPSSDASAPPIDLRDHYFRHHRLQFGLAAALVVASLCKTLALSGELPRREDLWGHVVFGALWAIGALTGKPWYHRLLLPISALAIVFYIVSLFARLD
jgi:hypothetical protein